LPEPLAISIHADRSFCLNTALVFLT